MPLKDSWTSIRNRAAADSLRKRVEWLHDSLTTKAVWDGAEFVNKLGEMEFHGYGSLLLRFTSQIEYVTACELRFGRVKNFSYNYDLDFDPTFIFKEHEVVARILVWQIVAQELDYREIG